MRSTRLLGRDHHELGAVELVGEGSTAIAISRGGAGKTYAYTDLNEDAVGFAVGERGSLLVVADGHHGAAGAELAVSHCLEICAPRWIGERDEPPSPSSWPEIARAALGEIDARVHDAAGDPAAPIPATTLSLAVVLPGARTLLHASVGDSHIFWCDRDGAHDLGFAAHAPPGMVCFLGLGFASEQAMREATACGHRSLDGGRALVLATDGLSEIGIGVDDPEATVAAALPAGGALTEDVRAVELCRNVIESALESHRRRRSGDNAAVAALWL